MEDKRYTSLTQLKKPTSVKAKTQLQIFISKSFPELLEKEFLKDFLKENNFENDLKEIIKNLKCLNNYRELNYQIVNRYTTLYIRNNHLILNFYDEIIYEYNFITNEENKANLDKNLSISLLNFLYEALYLIKENFLKSI